MLKLIIVFFCFSFFSLAFATEKFTVKSNVKFDEIIKNNIIEEINTATEVQQFAGVHSEAQNSEAQKKSAPDYSAAKNSAQVKKETDFQVVLRKKSVKKSEIKNPVAQRSIASKSNRVNKKTKKKNLTKN